VAEASTRLESRRYAFLTAPLRSLAEALAHRNPKNPEWQSQPVVEQLIQRLRDNLKDPACLGSSRGLKGMR